MSVDLFRYFPVFLSLPDEPPPPVEVARDVIEDVDVEQPLARELSWNDPL